MSINNVVTGIIVLALYSAGLIGGINFVFDLTIPLTFKTIAGTWLLILITLMTFREVK